MKEKFLRFSLKPSFDFAVILFGVSTFSVGYSILLILGDLKVSDIAPLSLKIVIFGVAFVMQLIATLFVAAKSVQFQKLKDKK